MCPGAPEEVGPGAVPPEWHGAPLLHAWAYRARDGKVLGWVARYASEGRRKTIIPFFDLEAGVWQKGGPQAPYPLFGLDTLAWGGPVCIVEGERCAAALQGLGLAGITSQGGSGAAKYADWTPLDGAGLVYLLPDNDEAGEHYAEEVAAQLAALPHPPRVKVARLAGLGSGEDVVDWLMARAPGWDGFTTLPPDSPLREELLQVITGGGN